MKRALTILGLIGVSTLITYLAVTGQMAQERAARLDRALMDAEARVVQLEADIEAAQQRLAELTQAGRPSRSPTASPRPLATTAGPAQPAEPPPAATAFAPGAPSPAGAAAAVTVAPFPVAGPLVHYAAFAGRGVSTLVRIEGTANIIHPTWQVEGHIIGGSARFGAGLPLRPGDTPSLGAVDAQVSAFIPIRSLKSVEKDGRPYSDKMDEILYGKLRDETNHHITYTLTSLTLKEQPQETKGPYVYEATGNLVVAGVTNTITMPVNVLPDPAGAIQFTGSVKLRMTDFKITPPSVNLAVGHIITGDEVTVRFVWWVRPRSPLQAGM